MNTIAKEQLQDELIKSLIDSINKDTDFDGIKDQLKEIISDNITSIYSEKYSLNDMYFDTEVIDGCVRYFNIDEICILIVEVI